MPQDELTLSWSGVFGYARLGNADTIRTLRAGMAEEGA